MHHLLLEPKAPPPSSPLCWMLSCTAVRVVPTGLTAWHSYWPSSWAATRVMRSVPEGRVT